MVVGDVTTAVDVLVLGGGPAGYVTAIRAAQLGRHVTLVASGTVGGTCLNRGCIPLKALLSASERYWQTLPEQLAPMGIAAPDLSFDWLKMQLWKQSVVDRLVDGVRRLIAGNRITLVRGTGWFINAQEVRVDSEEQPDRFKFEHCVLAVGALPAPLEGLPFDGLHVLTPEQALALKELPSSISIAGNDYIALELATLFARLGVKVNLYSPNEQLLTGLDPAAARLLQVGLRKLGISSKTKVAPTAISERPLVVSQTIEPATTSLHLAEAGIAVDERGGIIVNTMQQSSLPRVYAVGDCTGGEPLASIAIKQGKVAAEALSGQRVQYAPLVIPRVVHTFPELASVGYSPEEATSAGYTVTSSRFPLAANGRGLTLNSDNGAAFLTANKDDGLILGATIIAPHASDLIGQLALAIEMGATLTDLNEILYAHPGLSEMLQESAATALNQAIHILMKG